MADDFYPFVDSGDPAPDNAHITGEGSTSNINAGEGNVDQSEVESTVYATRISIYDDMLSTPRVVVVQPSDPRTYLEEVTNTVYRSMKEQGGSLPLMIIRELVENFIHAHFAEPIVSILDGGNTVRFADLGPGISDKERAFEFGVTSADRTMKRYIRGTGAGLPMVQQYLENAGGAVSIEDNLGCGTVVTVSVDANRVAEIERHAARGAAVRGAAFTSEPQAMPQPGYAPATAMQPPPAPNVIPGAQVPEYAYGYPYPMPAAPWQGWQGYAPAGTAPAAGTAYPAAPYPSGGAAPGYTQPGYTSMPPTPAPAPAAPAPVIDDRAAQALSFLAANGSGGPTDLCGTYGSSAPTWSRVISTLVSYGMVEKHGRRFTLTALGTAWVTEHPDGIQR